MGFVSQTHTVELEIDGYSFSLNLGGEGVMDAMKQSGDLLTSASGEKSSSELIKIVRGAIQKIIGDVHFNKVFENREKDLINEFMMLRYINDTIIESSAWETFLELANSVVSEDALVVLPEDV